MSININSFLKDWTAAIKMLDPIVKVMTVIIDESDLNPSTCCTYANDAACMTAGSNDWDKFFGHYPCLLNDGVEVARLNPNNFEEDINGNPIDITTGNNDVMVAFPRRGLMISKEENLVTISMVNTYHSDFSYAAHTRGLSLKNKFYLGTYMGSTIDSKLRSIKGQQVTTEQTIDQFRTLARANNNVNSGYDQHGWYQLMYLQAMYVLKYKNLNSQAVIGKGYVDNLDSDAGPIDTGGTETWGMDSQNRSTPSGLEHMKVFGLEDLWGNVRSFIDGIRSDKSRNILTATDNFNDDGTGYVNRGSSGFEKGTGRRIDKIQGNCHMGFFLSSDSGDGTSNEGYCDGGQFYANCVMYYGGYWNKRQTAGIFNCYLNDYSTYSSTNCGSRLMYL